MRFKNFNLEWSRIKISEIINFDTKIATTNLPVLTSGRNGLELQKDHFSSEQKHDISGYHLLLDNQCTFRNRSDDGYFTFNINHLGFSGVVSKFYPVFTFNNSNNDFIVMCLNLPKNAKQIKLLCTGTAQKVLSNGSLCKVCINIPTTNEQDKIVLFINLINKRIDTQNKIIRDLSLLNKNLIRSDILVNKNEFQERFLSDILKEVKILNKNRNEVYSVAVNEGLVNQIEHLGRSFSAKDTSKYHVVNYGNIVYTKSPTGIFPFGIVKQSSILKPVAVSPLYGIYEPNNFETGRYIHNYFISEINCNNYLKPLVNKGAKNTMNISNSHFLDGKIMFPNNQKHLSDLSELFNYLNCKIENEKELLDKYLNLKKYFLDNIFI